MNTEIDWSRLDGIASDLAFLKARLEAQKAVLDKLYADASRHDAAIIRMQTTMSRPSWFKRLFLAKWWH